MAKTKVKAKKANKAIKYNKDSKIIRKKTKLQVSMLLN